jgi:hypothetical protein
MNRYEVEEAWEAIRIDHLAVAADAMLTSDVKVWSSPLDNGNMARVTIQFTKNTDYLADPAAYFRILKSWSTLLEKVAPGERFSGPRMQHDSEFEANVIYRVPMRSARFAGQNGKTFIKHMALFEVALILAQAFGRGTYSRELLRKFPDPRHRWEVVIRKLPFLNNTPRIFVPKTPKAVPLRNRGYFDRW